MEKIYTIRLNTKAIINIYIYGLQIFPSVSVIITKLYHKGISDIFHTAYKYFSIYDSFYTFPEKNPVYIRSFAE